MQHPAGMYSQTIGVNCTASRLRTRQHDRKRRRTARQSNCCTWCSAASSSRSTGAEFVNTDELDIVGIYPNYAEAYKAWKAAAQRTVDNAHMRYFIVHMHRLLDPELTGPPRS